MRPYNHFIGLEVPGVLIIIAFVLALFITGCSDEKKTVSTGELQNLSLEMNKANDLFLQGTFYWDKAQYEQAKSLYESAEMKYESIVNNVTILSEKTSDVNLLKQLQFLKLTGENLANASREMSTASEIASEENKKMIPNQEAYQSHVDRAKEYSNIARQYYEQSKQV